MTKALLTISACTLYSIGLGQSASTDSSTLPEFSIYHTVLEWVNSLSVNATNQTIAHHFHGQSLPSIVYAEQNDSSIHVVHQQVPFEFTPEVFPALPAMDYKAMRTRQTDALHTDWYLMAIEPSRIIRKAGLLTDAPADTLISSDAVWVNFEVIDINSDGVNELVTVENGNNGKVILWSELNGTFVAQDTIGSAAYATHLHAFDLNYDAVPDFVVPGSPLRIFTSVNGAWELTASVAGRGNTDFADLDGDHDLDIATTDYYGATWSQIRNDLNGSFDIASAIVDTTSAQWYGEACRIADVTGDGAPDILLTRATNNTIYLWRNGLDEMNDLVELTPAGQAGIRHVSLVDMDLDGDLDWLGAGPYQHIGVLENTQIKFGCTYPLATNYSSLANADDGSCTFNPNICTNCPADLDGDLQIGTTDLLLMLSSFGQACPEPEAPEWACGDPVNYYGYDYATVQIGEQCWLAENLRSGHYRNGDEIPHYETSADWLGADADETGAWVYFDNDCTMGDAYGKLYNWYVIGDGRGVCPAEWHVPTNEEWNGLVNHYAGAEQAAAELKGYHSEAWNGSGSNGFNALPGGFRDWGNAVFFSESTSGDWWTSSTQGSAIWRGMEADSNGVSSALYNKRMGNSIRCIKDAE